ncbi:MAG: branched-chain amino acid transport system substrate-binding protein [Clostridiales bacterium]|jgi:branched-chain amino acid transport system substrate-binding protein|nr:branched-chain amino acid transport system substrate-binding protein [Clostridiales bacterium]MDN5281094.1 branched-chain amino acid transport system substrate-binding protein [Candidatus Ozemobacter sp.]
MKKKLLKIFRKMDVYQILSLVTLLALFWFSVDTNPSEIKIGVILPLTGANSARAISHEKGIMLAVDHVNRSGGINGKTLKLLIRDNKNDPALTALITRDLIYENQVLTLVGGIRPENARVIQLLSEKAKVPYLTALCTHYELTANGSEYTFRSITDDKKQFEAICEYSVRRFNARKPALIYDPLLYGSDSAQKFIESALKAGQQVVAAVSYKQGSVNYRDQLDVVRSSNPDSLVIIAPPKDSALILRQARENRFLKPILGVNPFSSHEFINYAGIYSELTICTLPFNSRLGGQRADYFLAEFFDKYGISADSDAALGYEAVMLTALALKAGEHDRKMIRDYLASMHGWESVTGSGGFDQNGNQVRPAEVAIIKERQKIPVNLEELF